jgi:lipid A ethanolaminephosphotransferase
MNRFKVQLDISMLMNVLETNFSETREFIDASLLLYILFFGIIPSFLIGRFISIINYRTLYTKLKFIAVNTAAIILIILISIKTPRIYEFLKRDNRYTVNYFIPINYLGNSVAAVLTKVRSAIPQKIIKIDIKQKRIGNDRKSLIVFILGESARTQNFSLNGYSRSTNKFLEKYNVISFKNVYSCGVSTAHSIPCIFSHLDRAHFTIGEAIKYENLLDIFKKIDYRVIWSSNNGGCKKVCDRVSYKKTVGLSRGRFDEALTTSFRREIKHLGDRNAFLLLNQIGSHEMYHKRYPKEFEEFKPSCKTTLDKCDYMERLNSYDNTILYSSYNIGQILEILSEELNDSFDTMLIYVSDHGDSLGEDNVWLHGMPYARANDYVKKVPMLLWFSNSFKKTYNIDEICLRNKIDHELSHDNIFHSLLGLLWIESEYYDENLDIFKDCRLP